MTKTNAPTLENARLDRRSFLTLSAATAAILPVASAAAASLAASPALAKGQWPGLNKIIVINALGGISNPNIKLQLENPGDGPNVNKPVPDETRRDIDSRALKDAHQSGLTAINITLGHVAGDMEPFEHTVKEIGAWDAIIRENARDLVKVRSGADILAAKRDGKIGVIYGFQNTTSLGDKAERVDIFGNLGVKVIQLTYNPHNLVGDGSMAPENKGLSPFGREVVARLNTNKILVDLSHSGEQTCLDAIKASNGPIAITHTGCRALADLPRNKTDAELKLLADKGGVAGIYFMPFLKVGAQPTASDVVLHIEHAINVCGEDHVGIGTDGSVTQIDDLPLFRKSIDKEIEARIKAGIGAKGESGTFPFIVDLRGVDQYQKLADLLAARGHKSARIEKILGRNFLRLMTDVWGV
ncbi:dipeptidase [Govanella unica]|uniref:Dipeptidase n=1 Tax=Govanella unica TaxID=2975056 RepID=A0A9X3TZV0_9PROT|nr:membrane dipeptidase [Govania unica]MDA5195020.1 dipeptidase [Govania unica]